MKWWKRKNFMVRQGDVLLIKCEEPKGETKDKGHRVLAEGEATDHIHTVRNKKVMLLDAGEKTYLKVPEGLGQVIDPDTGKCAFNDGTVLEHVNKNTGQKADHHAIPLPPGTYEVRRQREFVGGNKKEKEERITRVVWD